jgi:hypothetical protein
MNSIHGVIINNQFNRAKMKAYDKIFVLLETQFQIFGAKRFWSMDYGCHEAQGINESSS